MCIRDSVTRTAYRGRGMCLTLRARLKSLFYSFITSKMQFSNFILLSEIYTRPVDLLSYTMPNDTTTYACDIYSCFITKIKLEKHFRSVIISPFIITYHGLDTSPTTIVTRKRIKSQFNVTTGACSVFIYRARNKLCAETFLSLSVSLSLSLCFSL